MYISAPVHYQVGFAIQNQPNRPAQCADMDGLKISIEHQDRLMHTLGSFLTWQIIA
jgi:hypothetical protein